MGRLTTMRNAPALRTTFTEEDNDDLSEAVHP
jgi:hypothetical protein